MQTVEAEHLEWNKNLELGIPIIDSQHKVIVDYINELADASVSGDQPTIIEVTGKLIEYTVSHFEFEEMLQMEANYFAYETHKATHGIFTRQAQLYQRRAIKGEDISIPLSQMLRAWLVSHIQNEDREYVPVVKKVVAEKHLDEVRDGSEGSWLERSLKKVFG